MFTTYMLEKKYKTFLEKQSNILKAPMFDEHCNDEKECQDNLLKGLSNKEKKFLIMKYVEQYKHKEIAEKSGISVDCVKKIISRAKKKLRDALERKMEDEDLEEDLEEKRDGDEL